MKRNILIISVAFVVTLAVIFGIRASVDALAVVLGVVLGVAASVPTTFLVIYVLTRSRPGQESSSSQTSHQPPVVVINASDKPSISSSPGLPLPGSPITQARRWTVIGDTDTDVDS